MFVCVCVLHRYHKYILRLEMCSIHTELHCSDIRPKQESKLVIHTAFVRFHLGNFSQFWTVLERPTKASGWPNCVFKIQLGQKPSLGKFEKSCRCLTKNTVAHNVFMSWTHIPRTWDPRIGWVPPPEVNSMCCHFWGSPSLSCVMISSVF